ATPTKPHLIQETLYFGRNIGTTGQVTADQFRQFLNEEITPRFPHGLTVYRANGQFLDRSNRLIREASNVVSLVFPDTVENEASIDQIIRAYKQKFQQESVLEVVDKDVRISFDQSEDLTKNDLIPERIQVDLFLGRNIGADGQVTETQFQDFLQRVVTPRLPVHYMVYDAKGQFLDRDNRLIRELSKVISIAMLDTPENEQTVLEIIAQYKERFHQEAVLTVVDEDVKIRMMR
ncbi:MAG: DUF3574 domain-containing protein, partial [Oculatellaceae cyanobacterium Prado106]|nr:DUF3574 domain-containing protein [Oculatellaceae cyanobacterium Prado106]